jgi:outer membrane protein TolC
MRPLAKPVLLVVIHLMISIQLEGTSSAQSLPLQVTINQAVELSLRNFPSIRAGMAQAGAARGGVELAATSYLPRLDLLWQEIRATRNNVSGTLFPQSVIPGMSGGVRSSDAGESLWGSAGGVLFSWEIFDFGLRSANVQTAAAAASQANASLLLTQLEVASTAADSVVAVLAAEQTVRAAKANVERTRVLSSSIHVLVENELKPGADAARADAQLAAANTGLIQAEQVARMSRATLAEALGIAGASVTAVPGGLLDLPPQAVLSSRSLSSHPAARVQAAAVETVRARERALDRSDVPRISLQSSFSERGTGADRSGVPEGGGEGLLPETPNWGVGLSITYPLSEKFSLEAKRRIEAQNEMAERAKYDQILQNLKGQSARARIAVESAVKIAENTPIQLHAAQESETQARARFESLLAPLTELADAQRLLTQAEIDDSLARLNVWRALLFASKAGGDLNPFLQLAAYQPVGPGN